jgi:hypothetical protein
LPCGEHRNRYPDADEIRRAVIAKHHGDRAIASHSVGSSNPERPTPLSREKARRPRGTDVRSGLSFARLSAEPVKIPLTADSATTSQDGSGSGDA